MSMIPLATARAQAAQELLSEGAMGVEEAAEFSGLSRATLYRLMNRIDEATGGPVLPYVKMGPGGRRLIPKRALMQLMAGHLVIGERGLDVDANVTAIPGNRDRVPPGASEAPDERRGGRRRDTRR